MTAGYAAAASVLAAINFCLRDLKKTPLPHAKELRPSPALVPSGPPKLELAKGFEPPSL